MARLSCSVIRVVRTGVSLAVVATTCAMVAGGQDLFQGVSIKVSKETAPPGGMAQVKVFITEPKPISTGGGTYLFEAYDTIEGIALMNDLEDVAGIALVRGSQVALSFTSPSATFGLDPDYPVITVAGRIPSSAPIGTKYRLAFDESTLQLFDPFAVRYPIEAKPGHVIAWPGISIHGVSPGSGVVRSGDKVTITGSSFEPRTEIKFKETKLARVTYVSPNEMQVVMATTTSMHGMMIRASNPDGTQSTYFSYQRTRGDDALVSGDPVLRYAVPLVPPQGVTTADVTFPEPEAEANARRTFGVALQNIEKGPASISLALLDASGRLVAEADMLLSPNRFVVRELTELFGTAPNTPCTVHVSSATPVQVLGVAARIELQGDQYDETTATASPILPR